MNFLLQIFIAVFKIMFSFYGFWFVWQVLPILPGPKKNSKRIARFADYFTDPIVKPLAKILNVHPRLVCVLFLLLVGTAQVLLGSITL